MDGLPMDGSTWNAAAIVALILSVTSTSAADTRWQTFTIADTGLSVDVPVSIFTEDAGPTNEVKGHTFFTRDHRADLTVKSMPNPGNETPATFLKQMQPPTRIQYKRVTPNF